MSGGEIWPIDLALTLKQGGNLLLLDEPTNDLDVETLGSLENALEKFPGCAVVISATTAGSWIGPVPTSWPEGDASNEATWFWFEGNWRLRGEQGRASRHGKGRPQSDPSSMTRIDVAWVTVSERLAQRRSPGETLVEVDEDSSGPVLRVVTDRASALVDSITVLLLHRLGVGYLDADAFVALGHARRRRSRRSESTPGGSAIPVSPGSPLSWHPRSTGAPWPRRCACCRWSLPTRGRSPRTPQSSSRRCAILPMR